MTFPGIEHIVWYSAPVVVVKNHSTITRSQQFNTFYIALICFRNQGKVLFLYFNHNKYCIRTSLLVGKRMFSDSDKNISFTSLMRIKFYLEQRPWNLLLILAPSQLNISLTHYCSKHSGGRRWIALPDMLMTVLLSVTAGQLTDHPGVNRDEERGLNTFVSNGILGEVPLMVESFSSC